MRLILEIWWYIHMGHKLGHRCDCIHHSIIFFNGYWSDDILYRFPWKKTCCQPFQMNFLQRKVWISHEFVPVGQIYNNSTLVQLMTWNQTKHNLFPELVMSKIAVWMNNHIPSKVWDNVAYPFPNFNGFTIEVWEWINNFLPHFIMDVINYP